MNKHTAIKWFALSTLMGAAISTASAETYQGTFTTASVDIFDNSSDAGTSLVVDPLGLPIAVERGPSASGAHGKSRAALGSNGFMADSGAAGFSAWSDGFVVTGGTGSGQIEISITIHGAITGHEADMVYALNMSQTAFSIQSETGINDDNIDATLSHSTRILSYAINNSDASPNTVLTGKLNFTYGQKFYLLSYLGGDVCTPLEGPAHQGCTGGSEDFYHSAIFGMTAPTDAVITASSGHAYLAAVPEPGSWALVGIGLVTMALRRRLLQAAA